MSKLYKRLSKASGHVPGELIYVGENKSKNVKISLIDYGPKDFQEKIIDNIEEVFALKEAPTVTWINIDGLCRTDIIESVGTHFQVHPLTLEDIVTTGQRPKFENFDDYIFVVLTMFMFDDNKKDVVAEQVSLVLGPNFVISVQETEGDVFGPIRERIRTAKGRIRKMGADYLAYSLLDAVVDNYFNIMEKLGEKIENMEDELINDPSPRTLKTIHCLKQQILFLRKSVWPLRELVSGLERSESKLIAKGTRIFLRDLYDHTIQVIETVETFRDMVSGMLDIYLSSISNRMNEIMKVLTIFAAIFIPLTFIAGVYGMNFNSQASKWNMPELNSRFGYIGVWAVMLLVAASMLFYFRRKKWI
ncbi:MAG: magnesium/cobalt transporter CorA [Candidatus Omnitrophica bacterium]|nr:magnesium/cobalt transporter CorA [Candidatus Omnitrophota bacterium]